MIAIGRTRQFVVKFFITELGPGKYRFRVIACNTSGVRSQQARNRDRPDCSGLVPDELFPRTVCFPDVPGPLGRRLVMTVLQTMCGRAVIVRIRARHVLGIVLASLLLVALPAAHALDPDRRISQYGHTVGGASRMAPSLPPPISLKPPTGFSGSQLRKRLMRFDGVRVCAVAASPGTESARHTPLGSTRRSRWQPLDRYHTRFGSLEADGQLRTGYTDLQHPAPIAQVQLSRTTRDNMGDSLWACMQARSATVQHHRRHAALLRKKGWSPRRLRPRVDSR